MAVIADFPRASIHYTGRATQEKTRAVKQVLTARKKGDTHTHTPGAKSSSAVPTYLRIKLTDEWLCIRECVEKKLAARACVCVHAVICMRIYVSTNVPAGINFKPIRTARCD